MFSFCFSNFTVHILQDLKEIFKNMSLFGIYWCKKCTKKAVLTLQAALFALAAMRNR